MTLIRSHLARLAGPIATIGLAGASFLALTDSVREGDGIAGHDPSLTADLVGHRAGALTAIAQVLTFIGSEVIVGVSALGLIIVLLERRGPRYAIVAAAAMATSAAMTVGVKMAVARVRPGTADRLGPSDSTYSFPSGHSLNSAVLLGLVCVLLVPLLRNRRARIGAYGAATLLAAGIGASRVYLGYHWTTDVLASWAIASVIVAIVHGVSRPLTRSQERSGSSQVDRDTVDS